MKKILLLFLLLYTVQNILAQSNGFTLEINLDNPIPGYVYLSYEEKTDSSLVVNNQLRFKGFVEKSAALAGFYQPGKYFHFNKVLYLENRSIVVEANIVKLKVRKNDTLTRLEVRSVCDSYTTDLNDAFQAYLRGHKKDYDYKEQLLKRADDIISLNPKNPIAASVLHQLMTMRLYQNDLLIKRYKKLDVDFQEILTLREIENELFPKDFVATNEPMFHFTLPDANDQPFDTKSIQGQWILIDFWASWCGGCREQFPELTRLYETYQSKNFEIVAVSIDKEPESWHKALDVEQPKWINLLEVKGETGAVAKRYNIVGVPHNYLIDPSGTIIAKDISLGALEKVLQNL